MVRVLIVEDQMIMQKYFEYLILQEPEFKLVECWNAPVFSGC